MSVVPPNLSKSLERLESRASFKFGSHEAMRVSDWILSETIQLLSLITD